MKISIITAVYNNESTIASCVQSVLSQKYDNIQHVIIDGNSADNTLNIIESINDTNRILISEKDKGIYDALNKGIKVSTGDVIGLLHSDDTFYDENVIPLIAETFKNTDAEIVYGNLIYVKKEDPTKVIRYWQSNDYSLNLLKKGWMPPHPTVFVKRKVFEEVGYYNLSYKIAADYDFIIRIFKENKYKTTYIPSIITSMKLGGASNKSIKNIIKKSKEDYKIIKANKIGGIRTLLIKNFSKIAQFIG